MNLILKAQTAVVETNIKPFVEQAQLYLANINKNLQTDEDFLEAEKNCSDLKALENKTLTTIEEVVNGNLEMEQIIEQARSIANEFRNTRLMLEKLIKKEKESRKLELINKGIERVEQEKYRNENFISMLETKFPRSFILNRIQTATKNKKNLSSIERAIDEEVKQLIFNLSEEHKRLKERAKLLEEDKYLFPDYIHLILSDQNLEEIIQERKEAEAKRIAEQEAKMEERAKLKAEQELVNKIQTEQAAVAQLEKEAITEKITIQAPPLTTKQEMAAKENANETIKEEFKILLRCDLETARQVARLITENYGNQIFYGLRKGN